eukprot:6467755-Amphidinium_carterae.1
MKLVVTIPGKLMGRNPQLQFKGWTHHCAYAAAAKVGVACPRIRECSLWRLHHPCPSATGP